jgi:signal transduction histidine kinase
VTWYRSLYWRIAVGFIACLALLLVVQGMLFVWTMSKAGSTIPNQPPERFAQTVAIDVAQALDRDPALDVERYVRQEYANDAQPFFIVLTQGTAIEMGASFPDTLKDEARTRLALLKSIDPARLARGGFGRGAPFRFGGPFNSPRQPPGSPDAPDRQRVPLPESSSASQNAGRPGVPGQRVGVFGRGGIGIGAFRGGRPVPIVANGQLAGLVVVPPQPPFTFLLRRYAPTLITVAAVTLVLGGVLAAVIVFGPTRRRLKGVEDAARRLGGGDLSARAPASGDDEVAAVARAFNAMAADLAARTEALVAADRARRQLLADVSHELNTPVTAMRGYLETLSMPELALDDATRARYLTIVGDETARLERIIGDLLDLARLEGGGGSLQLESVRVEDLFARVVARHERSAAAAKVAFSTAIQAGADTIVADRTRIEQALQNLAANALRYAPEGTTVRLDASSEGDTVTLRVSDHGPGIAAEHLARVFDRFYKVDEARAARAEAGGSGLGLSIVKAIVERHGARITVASAPGHTVFEICGMKKAGSADAPAA